MIFILILILIPISDDFFFIIEHSQAVCTWHVSGAIFSFPSYTHQPNTYTVTDILLLFVRALHHNDPEASLQATSHFVFKVHLSPQQ